MYLQSQVNDFSSVNHKQSGAYCQLLVSYRLIIIFSVIKPISFSEYYHGDQKRCRSYEPITNAYRRRDVSYRLLDVQVL